MDNVLLKMSIHTNQIVFERLVVLVIVIYNLNDTLLAIPHTMLVHLYQCIYPSVLFLVNILSQILLYNFILPGVSFMCSLPNEYVFLIEYLYFFFLCSLWLPFYYNIILIVKNRIRRLGKIFKYKSLVFIFLKLYQVFTKQQKCQKCSFNIHTENENLK